jgi:EAL domain-containing protein (putative c-di-GMP-specific phosphodiesterase class I)
MMKRPRIQVTVQQVSALDQTLQTKRVAEGVEQQKDEARR